MIGCGKFLYVCINPTRIGKPKVDSTLEPIVQLTTRELVTFTVRNDGYSRRVEMRVVVLGKSMW